MLQITIPAEEYWDASKQEFVYAGEKTIQLEHSLISLAKWESKHQKVFLDKGEKTVEELIDYIKCMTITQNVDSSVYLRLTEQNFKDINDYIENPMSATFFSEDKTNRKAPSREKVTAEIIYYWMVTLQIPFECQKWHLNRLLTLIRVCSVKNQPPKKMSKRQIMSRNSALNAARRKQLGTKG